MFHLVPSVYFDTVMISSASVQEILWQGLQKNIIHESQMIQMSPTYVLQCFHSKFQQQHTDKGHRSKIRTKKQRIGYRVNHTI